MGERFNFLELFRNISQYISYTTPKFEKNERIKNEEEEEEEEEEI